MINEEVFQFFLVAVLLFYKTDIFGPKNDVKDMELGGIKDEYDFIIVGGGTAERLSFEIMNSNILDENGFNVKSTIDFNQQVFKRLENALCGKSLSKKINYGFNDPEKAGCVLAARLSEITDWDILLIEAGGPAPITSHVPFLYQRIIDSNLDWKYRTVSQLNTCMENSGICKIPSGKMLGGTHAMNSMTHLKGHPKDFDNWEAEGNTGWGWSRSSLYFNLMENNTKSKYARDKENHNQTGPLAVSENNYRSKIANVFLEAAKQIGYKIIDLNGSKRTGFMNFHGNIKEGKRDSTSSAYLKPASERKNIQISQFSVVKKIEFEGKKATGVVFEKKGFVKKVKARKEVILSAGTIASAQILMISGVGPKKILESLEIPVVANLPVGKNLKDHIAVAMTFSVNQTGLVINPDDFVNPKSILDYTLHFDGPLSSPFGIETLGFIASNQAERKNDHPSIQMIMSAFGGSKNTFLIGGFPLRPNSVGEVVVTSKDQAVHPLINPNYLNDKKDLEIMVKVINHILKLSKTPAMAKIGAKMVKESISRCPQALGTREFAECYSKEYSSSIHHPVGTCRMHKNGVVDPELKVHSLEGIRVVDASIMTDIVSSDINAVVIMVAETAADLIKKKHGKPVLIDYKKPPKKNSQRRGLFGFPCFFCNLLN